MNRMTICAKTIQACLAGGMLAGFLGGLGPVACPLHAATLWSTNANGSAKQFELTCGTCPNPVTVLSNLTDGGFGNTSAAVEFSQSDLVSYSANSIFTGPNSLPPGGVGSWQYRSRGAFHVFLFRERRGPRDPDVPMPAPLQRITRSSTISTGI